MADKSGNDTTMPDMAPDDTVDPTAEEAGRVATHLNEAPDGEAPAGDGRGEGEDRVEVRGPHDDKRANIAKNYRDRSRAENKQSMEQIDPNDKNLNFGEHAVDATLNPTDEDDDQEKEALRRAQHPEGDDEQRTAAPPTQTDEDPDIEVTVNGQRTLIKQSQLISNFQKNSAADERLRHASELVKAAAQLATPQPAPIADTEAEPTPARPASTSPPSAMSDEDLAKLAEKVQFGEPAESAKALRAVIEGVVGARQQPEPTAPVDIRSQVRLANEEERSEEALKKFVQDNAELANDPALQRVTADFAHTEMMQDVRTAVRESGLSDDMLPKTTQHLLDAHKALRVGGYTGIRSSAEILTASLKAAKEQAAKWAGVVAAPATADSRLERKRISVQTQPAQRGQVPKTPATAGERDHSATVTKMRQARHQTV